jgi:23S rRNA (uracil1939-C5)-methyltransferase
MSVGETGDPVIRLAAKGDGLTKGGVHLPATAPGDTLMPDGSIMPGPHRQEPPCRHFPTCGGCQLQHVDDAALTDFVVDRCVNAARGQGIEPREILPAHLSPPHTRRRASIALSRRKSRVLAGFREERSHRIVDLKQCEILHPALFAMIAPLRRFIAGLPDPGKPVEGAAQMTLTDSGVDLTLEGFAFDGLDAIEALLDFARTHQLARLSVDEGFGPEARWEPEPVTITLGNVRVPFPQGAFLQATADGETALTGFAAQALEGCARVADLFAGLGTFAFALPEATRVLAAEAARDAYLACKAAAGGRQVFPLHRDLFRNSLQAGEMAPLDGVILDPPRAGARQQVEQIAASSVNRVVYVSCNPQSWARDAAVLIAGGYELARLLPVGQFRWSSHVELASLFLRKDA